MKLLGKQTSQLCFFYLFISGFIVWTFVNEENNSQPKKKKTHTHTKTSLDLTSRNTCKTVFSLFLYHIILLISLLPLKTISSPRAQAEALVKQIVFIIWFGFMVLHWNQQPLQLDGHCLCHLYWRSLWNWLIPQRLRKLTHFNFTSFINVTVFNSTVSLSVGQYLQP